MWEYIRIQPEKNRIKGDIYEAIYFKELAYSDCGIWLGKSHSKVEFGRKGKLEVSNVG